MIKDENISNQSNTLLEGLLIIAKHKIMITLTTVFVSILAVIYVLVTPQYWTSDVTFVPVESEKIGFTLGSSLLGSGVSLLGSGIEGTANNYITIMQSRMFAKKVIKKFELETYYDIENEDSLQVFYDVYQLIQKDVKIGFDAKFGTISISVTTKDKYLSAEMANFYWFELERYNQNDRLTKGKQKRVFLEARVLELKESIDQTMKLITQFKEENKAIEIEAQTLTTISMYAELVTQKSIIEMELEHNLNYFPESSPNIEKLKDKLIIIRKEISKIEITKANNRPKYIIGLDDIPSLSSEYALLEMNLLIYNKVYEFLYPQLENAKIEEIKDLPTLEVIDKAMPAGYRTRPKRARTCILMFFLGLITSILSAFLVERINGIKKDSTQFAVLNEIRKHLKFRK